MNQILYAFMLGYSEQMIKESTSAEDRKFSHKFFTNTVLQLQIISGSFNYLPVANYVEITCPI